METKLRKNIKIIGDYLIDFDVQKNMLLSSDYGGVGISLFLLANYLFTGETKFLDQCQTNFGKAAEALSEVKAEFNYIDIMNFARYVQFLTSKQLVSFDQSLILGQVDKFLVDTIKILIEQGNYDLVGGVLDVANYFFQRRTENAFVDRTLEDILICLEDISVSDNDGGLFWKSHLYDGNRIYLGLHGSASILVFLGKLVSSGILIERSCELMKKTSKFIISNKLCDNPNRFPQVINISLEEYSLEYVYSDLYIGYGLHVAGRLLNDEFLTQESELIFQNSFKHLESSEAIDNAIRDTGLAYGVEGTYLIYNKMSSTDMRLDFEWAKKKCIEHSIFKNNFGTNKVYLGYEPKILAHNPGSYTGLINGLAGIGLSYISYCNPEIKFYENFVYL